MRKNLLISLFLIGLTLGQQACLWLKKTTKNALRMQLVIYAQGFIGTPYKTAGNTPKGFDCSGFTQYVFKQYNYSLPRNSKQQAKHGFPKTIREVKMGDLVYFGVNKQGVNHVGIIVENRANNLHMIHVSSSKGVVTTNIHASKYWKNRLLGFRRIIQ